MKFFLELLSVRNRIRSDFFSLFSTVLALQICRGFKFLELELWNSRLKIIKWNFSNADGTVITLDIRDKDNFVLFLGEFNSCRRWYGKGNNFSLFVKCCLPSHVFPPEGYFLGGSLILVRCGSLSIFPRFIP